MTLGRLAILAALLLAPLLASPGLAQQSGGGGAPVIFMPPAVGAPADRVGASTRQARGEEAAIELLAPVGGGYTLRPSPTLFWRVAGPLQGSMRIDLRDHEGGEPILTAFRNDGVFDGLESLDLGAHGASLEPRRLYVWSITLLLPDGRQIEERSFIERVEFSSGIMASIDQEEPASLANYGIWYDALELLAGRAEAGAGGEEALEAYLDSGMN